MSEFAKGSRFFYRAFGLVVMSDIPLGGVIAIEPAPPSITVVRSASSSPVELGADHFSFSADHQVLCWSRVGRFEICGLDRIEYCLCEGTDPSLASFPILGPVFGLLLHLRGLLVLHASALLLETGSMILLGDKGAGKSTTAAAMMAAGMKLLSDDLAVIGLGSSGVFTLFPAFPQIKLTENSLAGLEQSVFGLPPAPHSLIGKVVLPVPGNFSETPARVVGAALLGRGEVASFLPVSAADALGAILKFSYASRFNLTGLPHAIAAAHLRLCAKFVADVRVGTLTVPSSIASLGFAADLLQREFGHG